eukprot:5705630-Amphidinium_carterae.1
MRQNVSCHDVLNKPTETDVRCGQTCRSYYRGVVHSSLEMLRCSISLYLTLRFAACSGEVVLGLAA